MRVVEFLAEAALTGKVAGLGLGVSAERIRDVLGNESVAGRTKKSLRLDYGILEFNFLSGSCETIGIQVHRLVHGSDGLIPAALDVSFREVEGAVHLGPVRNEIERGGGYSLEECQSQHGYRRYRVAGSHVNLYVVAETPPGSHLLAAEDLWSVLISNKG
ncbi:MULTISPECIES: hypothetical protein [Actinoalloteichus]|uniref:Uncharacterized protein n=1 Tax=Actinoalloteichus fjordicus TaxID=1612552 RepID=A0AAC9L8R1_9PSEU|nr:MULTISPECIES: hypothetical protein [Actinoalloteichus]APU13258.1 hypothetical protein UA74_05920 [Actinoalloteichus fjordicus]APU19209.1 hypothetical protein UA75_05925 [Actinoalloteichus sp. GBA129-24]